MTTYLFSLNLIIDINWLRFWPGIPKNYIHIGLWILIRLVELHKQWWLLGKLVGRGIQMKLPIKPVGQASVVYPKQI